jgi:ABC-type uncharacterized transport system substrate-binding protein
MAGRSARAGERADAAHRRASTRHRQRRRISGPHGGVSARAGAIGLERRPQRAYRHPLRRWRCQFYSQICGRTDRAYAGCYPGPGSTSLGPLLQATRTVPIVFTTILDPVGAGFVDSLARPGGNATGFVAFEYGLSGKWLELLKQIAPSLTRVGILRDPATAAGIGQFAAIQSVAPSFGVELRPIDMREVGEIERAVTTFAHFSNAGLIVTAGSGSAIHGDLIITLAARQKLPAVYSDRHFVTGGGLVSYGPDRVDQYRRAAAYVDRIFKGENPADLPVQAPTKYELVINLKTAKTLGLSVPTTLLASANEVIE